jgi:ATP-dependent Clp protease ATP-binding subunit ClpB
LTDSHGRKVDFRSTIVIMTSNLGSDIIDSLPDHMKGVEPEVIDRVMDRVRSSLSPELVNRIDECVVFSRLHRDSMDSIVKVQLEKVHARLSETHNMKLDVSKEAASSIAETGYDPRYGARPLKRCVQSHILNPLSRLVLESSILEGETIRVRTLGEIKESKEDISHGWVSYRGNSSNNGASTDEDSDSVVVLRNHRK